MQKYSGALALQLSSLPPQLGQSGADSKLRTILAPQEQIWAARPVLKNLCSWGEHSPAFFPGLIPEESPENSFLIEGDILRPVSVRAIHAHMQTHVHLSTALLRKLEARRSFGVGAYKCGSIFLG